MYTRVVNALLICLTKRVQPAAHINVHTLQFIGVKVEEVAVAHNSFCSIIGGDILNTKLRGATSIGHVYHVSKVSMKDFGSVVLKQFLKHPSYASVATFMGREGRLYNEDSVLVKAIENGVEVFEIHVGEVPILDHIDIVFACYKRMLRLTSHAHHLLSRFRRILCRGFSGDLPKTDCCQESVAGQIPFCSASAYTCRRPASGVQTR